jgi:cofilin
MDPHLKTGGEVLEYEKGHKQGIMGNEVSDDCLPTFEQLKIRRKHRFIIYKLGFENVEIEKIGERGASFDDFKKALPYSEPRYGVFDQDYKSEDGRPVNKLWFVSWSPTNSTPHNKMAYSSAKGKFRELLKGVFDTQAANTDDLEEAFGLKVEEEEDDDDDF